MTKDTDKELRLRGKLPLFAQPLTSKPKILGRLVNGNHLCPCRSGKKYKKCCKNAPPATEEPGVWLNS